MPQPKKSSSSKRSSSRSKKPTGSTRRSSSSSGAGRRRSSAEPSPAGGVAALRSVLALGATDPLGLVMLTRKLIQETFDEAVARGHMTREAANDLAETLVGRSRREAQDIFADLDQLVGRGRTGLEAAGRRARSSAADRALQQVDRARRAAGASFPISNYDDLRAGQIVDRLDGLSPAELRKVRDYERRHGNRKSVLGAVEKQLA
jgi:polyhydroxyalkanoate synthesis regulator phasin